MPEGSHNIHTISLTHSNATKTLHIHRKAPRIRKKCHTYQQSSPDPCYQSDIGDNFHIYDAYQSCDLLINLKKIIISDQSDINDA